MRKIRQALELQCHCHGATRSVCQTGARVTATCRLQRGSERAPPRSGARPKDFPRLRPRAFAARAWMDRLGSTSARAGRLRPCPFGRGMSARLATRRAGSALSARPGSTQPKRHVTVASRAPDLQCVADRSALTASAVGRLRQGVPVKNIFRPENASRALRSGMGLRRGIGAAPRTPIPASSRPRVPRPPIAAAAPTRSTARAGRSSRRWQACRGCR